MPRRPSFWRSESGASAVEFVLVLPVAIFLTLGAINMSIMLFAVTNLNNSADEAARWAALQTTVTGTAPSQTAVAAYANSRYAGPGVTRTYTYNSAATCGNQVSVAASYKLITGIYSPTVPITAKSCFS